MKKEYYVITATLILAVLFLGCTSQKTAQNGDTVKVEYIGTLENGTEFDSGKLEFVIGTKRVIRGFEYGVIGMKEGESKKITISPENAYGEHKESLVKSEKIEKLESKGYSTKMGTDIVLVYQNQTIKGRIIGTNGTHVDLDFNHPLAGKELTFNITLIEIGTQTTGQFK